MSDVITEILNDPAVTAVGIAVGIAVLALWLAAAWWAYADATRRTERSLAGFVASGWILLSTPVLLPLALAVYTFARPRLSAGDRRVGILAGHLTSTADDPRCPACDAAIEMAWRRCPACSTWLAVSCSACGRWSEVALEICPWCGSESRGQADAAAADALPAAAADGPVRQGQARRAASSARPLSYAASRDISSASS